MADSVIVGRFAENGENALAAVGASFPITMIFMAIAVGSNAGCSVVISHLFGSGRHQEMKTAISTALRASLCVSALLTFLGVILSKQMMHWIQTPENIFVDGKLYLMIYIAGFGFMFIYNVCTGIFQAMGDSKTPLYFLIGSSLGNILLDFIFVYFCHWDVAGVAWATFICQGIACVLAYFTMLKRIKCVETSGCPPHFSWKMLREIGRMAIPSILQQSFVSVGNLFIQGLVNSCGSAVIAGYSAAIKLNTFAITSFSTLGNGISGFTAQNMGAGKIDRVKAGLRNAVMLSGGIAVLFCGLYFFLGEPLVGVFMTESSAVALGVGVQFLKIVSPYYFVIMLKLSIDGVLRGTGCMIAFMTSTFSDLILRVILAFVMFSHPDPTGIWQSWPIGWSVAMVISVLFYLSGSWKKSKILA